MVIPCGRPSGLLNKKQSRKNSNFERSTRKELSRFEHVKRNFSCSQSQQRICKSGIRGNAIRREQNQAQNQPQNHQTV